VSFLLDTVVVSECVKPAPEPRVVEWLASIDEDRVFLSVATIAEIRHGIETMPIGRRRARLLAWFDGDLSLRFEGRILDIDRGICAAWGVVMARATAVGKSLATMDAFFAATAEVLGLTLVTRDIRDFQGAGIALFDPWGAP